jgi:capsular polysaccharide biosynthesis protein
MFSDPIPHIHEPTLETPVVRSSHIAPSRGMNLAAVLVAAVALLVVLAFLFDMF